MKYIHFFTTHTSHSEAWSNWGGEVYKEPWIGFDTETQSITYNNPDYVEIPEGYTFFAKGPVTIDSSPVGSSSASPGKVSSSLLYSYPEKSENYYKLYINGIVYPLKKRYIMNEFDHYYNTDLADGTYEDCIYLV